MDHHESSQKVPEDRFATVYALLSKAVSEHVFPGAALGVYYRGGVVLQSAAGRQTYDTGSPVILPFTVYDLASLTKVAATTGMAMLLYQRGKLDLDLPIVEVLPAFAEQGAAGDRGRVTVRHLLAHNSGLAGYARLFESHRTPEALFEACLRMPLEAAPGERAEYSDIGFILLGRVLEIVASQPLDKFCREEIFGPLGMTNICFRPSETMRSAIPPSEDDQAFRHRVIQGEVQDENCWVLGGVSGHAGLFGNVDDILRYAQAILQADGPDSIFAAKTVELFATRADQPPASSRALGWDTPSRPSSSGTMFSEKSIGHLGYAGTSLWMDREAGCAIVLLTNRTWPFRENQTIRNFRPVLHNAIRTALL